MRKIFSKAAQRCRVRLANWLAPVILPDLEDRVRATIEDFDYDEIVENTLAKGSLLQEAVDNIDLGEKIESAINETIANSDDVEQTIEQMVREKLAEIYQELAENVDGKPLRKRRR